jgi:hypothetical protein
MLCQPRRMPNAAERQPNLAYRQLSPKPKFDATKSRCGRMEVLWTNCQLDLYRHL